MRWTRRAERSGPLIYPTELPCQVVCVIAGAMILTSWI